MRAAREMGLISDVGYIQLDHIRDMPNFASAAHPNHNTLTGLQLVTWLETCIREGTGVGAAARRDRAAPGAGARRAVRPGRAWRTRPGCSRLSSRGWS